ncbi:hypothetical protein GOBAR_AA06700 [Gossypium barbadense]|uniref:PGG domain-containing protein n=1 Tax=Gossypium barbadense TaxID=3634 RepID=A0A2P5YE40_GOSBA|nr:hypothetical protein GOBAR_AA06700 [Gossypium barbadense]
MQARVGASQNGRLKERKLYLRTGCARRNKIVINKGIRQDVFEGKFPTKSVKEEKTQFAKVENEVLEQGQLEIKYLVTTKLKNLHTACKHVVARMLAVTVACLCVQAMFIKLLGYLVVVGIINGASSSSQATTVVNLRSNGNPTTTAMIMGSMYALHVPVGTRKGGDGQWKQGNHSFDNWCHRNPRYRQVTGSATQFGHKETLLYLLHVTKAEVQPSSYEKLLYPELAKDFGLESPSCSIAVMNLAFFSSSELTLRDCLIDSCVPSTLSLENVANNSNRGDIKNPANKSQEVEKMVPNIYQDARNIERKTPRMVFTEEHKELVKEGERWMKDAANSCSVVATLIATVVFAAAIVVLGGTNGDSEFLVFEREKAFVIFTMSDALSLFSSTATILMFLSMLTDRYVGDDFLQALPKRLIMGLLTLFISITTMMVAFSSTLYLVFGEAKTWILVCVAEPTRVLVTLFIYL